VTKVLVAAAISGAVTVFSCGLRTVFTGTHASICYGDSVHSCEITKQNIQKRIPA